MERRKLAKHAQSDEAIRTSLFLATGTKKHLIRELGIRICNIALELQIYHIAKFILKNR